MNMILDLAFLVFAVATIWKFRKLSKKIKILQEDLELVIRNPPAAKRKLKDRT